MSNEPIIQDHVMDLIHKGEIRMKPKWLIGLGSIAMFAGLIALALVLVYIVSVVSFSLRTHGPMGSVRFQELLDSFPLWAPFAATIGVGLGVWMLRTYDFSYKKNFTFVIVSLLTAVLIAGWLIDWLGYSSIWLRHWQPQRGMHGFYHQSH